MGKLKKVEFQFIFAKPRKVRFGTIYSFRNGHSKLCKLHLKLIYILFKAEEDLFCQLKTYMKRKQMAFPEHEFQLLLRYIIVTFSAKYLALLFQETRFKRILILSVCCSAESYLLLQYKLTVFAY